MALPEEQVKFLVSLQRLLAEGQFVSSYKYALLLALAELSVERGSDTDDALEPPIRSIAEKFIQYYWRQTLPYVSTSGGGGAEILKQNSGKQAAILRHLGETRADYGDLATFRSGSPKAGITWSARWTPF